MLIKISSIMQRVIKKEERKIANENPRYDLVK